MTLKILHVIDSLNQSMGGPPQVCAFLLAEQAREHECWVASYASNEEEVPLPDDVRRVTIKGSGIKEKLLQRESKLAFEALDVPFDVLHLHNVWEPLLVAASNFANNRKIPYVVTPHGMLDPWSMSQKATKKKIALTLGRRRTLERAKFIHVLNDQEKDGVRALGIKNRCEVIANGVDLEKVDAALDPVPFQQQSPEICRHPFVLFLSRLHYKKGLDILAAAAPEFFEKFPDWRIVVAGPDGGAQAKFEASIAESGCSEKVHVIGPIYGERKFSLLANCEIFCLPSRQEGFSVAILEALSVSKPAAITSHCHFDEVATHNCGTVDSLDPAAITKSLCKLAGSSKRKQMGQNGRKLVEEKYTWCRISEKLLAQYLS